MNRCHKTTSSPSTLGRNPIPLVRITFISQPSSTKLNQTLEHVFHKNYHQLTVETSEKRHPKSVLKTTWLGLKSNPSPTPNGQQSISHQCLDPLLVREARSEKRRLCHGTSQRPHPTGFWRCFSQRCSTEMWDSPAIPCGKLT